MIKSLIGSNVYPDIDSVGKIIYLKLESRGIEVCLANARYVRNVPGRKSDISDSGWIQQLHSYGLLTGSFIAEGKIRELRAYVRQRENLEKQKALQLNLMGRSLQLLNVKLHQVASNLEIQVSMSTHFLRFH